MKSRWRTLRSTGAKVLITACEIDGCAAPAPFGYVPSTYTPSRYRPETNAHGNPTGNLVRMPVQRVCDPAKGRWYCNEHRTMGESLCH